MVGGRADSLFGGAGRGGGRVRHRRSAGTRRRRPSQPWLPPQSLFRRRHPTGRCRETPCGVAPRSSRVSSLTESRCRVAPPAPGSVCDWTMFSENGEPATDVTGTRDVFSPQRERRRSPRQPPIPGGVRGVPRDAEALEEIQDADDADQDDDQRFEGASGLGQRVRQGRSRRHRMASEAHRARRSPARAREKWPAPRTDALEGAPNNGEDPA